MDIFRQPKWAADFYKSQQDPKKGFVLTPLTRWTKGERDAGLLSPVWIITNCDYVEVYQNGRLIGTGEPNSEEFQGLKHPPIKFEKLQTGWGQNWQDGQFIGYYNGKKVIEKTLAANPVPTTIAVKADTNTLYADATDMTRVVVKALDQTKNPLYFYTGAIKVKVSGEGKLIGPECFALQNGVGAFFVKAGSKKGEIKIEVSESRFKKARITIKTI